MFRKNTITIIAALVLMLVIALAACAETKPGPIQPQGWNPAAMQGDVHPGALASLTRILMPPRPRELQNLGMAMNLTDAQKASIRELYKTFAETMKQIAPTRGADLKAAVNVMQSPTPSKDALLAAAAKVQQDDNAITSAEFDFWTGLRGILNPQQQAAVQNFVQQRALTEINGGPKQGPHPQGAPKK